MKERKHYEVPSITVINMDAENDIIQTSGATYDVKLQNIKQAKSTMIIDANQLFN